MCTIKRTPSMLIPMSFFTVHKSALIMLSPLFNHQTVLKSKMPRTNIPHIKNWKLQSIPSQLRQEMESNIRLFITFICQVEIRMQSDRSSHILSGEWICFSINKYLVLNAWNVRIELLQPNDIQYHPIGLKCF